MAPSPRNSQLPGIADAQVGTSDLADQIYPWSQHYPHPNPMRLGPETAIDSNHPSSAPPNVRPQFLRLYGTIARHPIQESPAAHTLWMLEPTPPAHVSQLPLLGQLGTGQDVPLSHTHNYLSTAPVETRLVFPSQSLNAAREELSRGGEHANPVNEFARETSLPSKKEQNADTNSDGFTPVCEYSTPCPMSTGSEGVYFRKVVSHLFGRNKTSTKLFPNHIWVYYCRRHYQRARYRAEQWPFVQAELLLQTLERMEEWGQVESFELRLRRRETLRAHPEQTTTTGCTTNGRRRPITISAPVPSWLHAEVGKDKTFNDIRRIVERIRAYLAQVQQDEAPKTDTKGTARNTACRSSSLHFPDIEFLPIFRRQFLKEAKLHASQKRGHEAAEKANGLNGVEEPEDNSEDGMPDDEGNPTSSTHKGQRKGGFARVTAHGAVKKPKHGRKK